MKQSGNKNLENNNGMNDSKINDSKINDSKTNDIKIKHSEISDKDLNDKSNETDKYDSLENSYISGLKEDDHIKKVNAETMTVDLKQNHIDDVDLKEQDKEEKEINYMKEIGEMILYFLVVIALVAFVYTFIGEQVEVSGSSMLSTLQDKNHLILEKVSYRFHEPERFDIVVFRPYEDNDKLYFIKRIIGLPGETVQIIGSDIYINGEVLEENYGREPIEDGGIANDPITLGKDEYFVLGDNRNNSKDSRFEEVGLVKRDAIIGRAWMRIWPLDEVGILKHR